MTSGKSVRIVTLLILTARVHMHRCTDAIKDQPGPEGSTSISAVPRPASVSLKKRLTSPAMPAGRKRWDEDAPSGAQIEAVQADAAVC